MKNFIAILLTGLLLAPSAFSQSCSAMFPMKRGLKYQQCSYDGSGNLETIADATVTSVRRTEGRVIADVSIVGEIVSSHAVFHRNIKVECNGDITYFDESSLALPDFSPEFQQYNIRWDNTPIELPYNLQPEQTLAGYSSIATGEYEGYVLRATSVTTARTVVGKEEVETPAGTFNCYLITSIQQTVSSVMGLMDIEVITEIKHWVAKGIGTVKRELYRDGSLDKIELLTKFERF